MPTTPQQVTSTFSFSTRCKAKKLEIIVNYNRFQATCLFVLLLFTFRDSKSSPQPNADEIPKYLKEDKTAMLNLIMSMKITITPDLLHRILTSFQKSHKLEIPQQRPSDLTLSNYRVQQFRGIKPNSILFCKFPTS